jgi:hypothetical protein
MLGNTKILKYWVGKTQKMPLKIFKKFGLALTIVAQNQVKTLSWENSGKSNLTPPPPPPPPPQRQSLGNGPGVGPYLFSL